MARCFDRDLVPVTWWWGVLGGVWVFGWRLGGFLLLDLRIMLGVIFWSFLVRLSRRYACFPTFKSFSILEEVLDVFMGFEGFSGVALERFLEVLETGNHNIKT